MHSEQPEGFEASQPSTSNTLPQADQPTVSPVVEAGPQPGPSQPSAPQPGLSQPPAPQPGPSQPSATVSIGERMCWVSLTDLESVLSRRSHCPWCRRMPDGSRPGRGLLARRRVRGRGGRGLPQPVPGLVPRGHRVHAPTWTPSVPGTSSRARRGAARTRPRPAVSGTSWPAIGHQSAANHSTDLEEDSDIDIVS